MSARSSPPVPSANTSGAVHGMDMPTVPPDTDGIELCTEMPKSDSAGWPKSVVSTLAGLMSRCRMPARWAVSTAPASRTPIRSTSATLIRSARYRTERLGREQYSITRYGRPSPAMPAWWMVTIAGWVDSAAIRLASASNCASSSPSAAPGMSTLTATGRRGSSWSYR